MHQGTQAFRRKNLKNASAFFLTVLLSEHLLSLWQPLYVPLRVTRSLLRTSLYSRDCYQAACQNNEDLSYKKII